MASSSKLGSPWPLAYGYVRASGYQSSLHQLGDSSLVGVNLLGEGPWSGRIASWINGTSFGSAPLGSLMPDDEVFHFHPGIDSPLGSTLTPNSAGGDQLVDSFWAFTGAVSQWLETQAEYVGFPGTGNIYWNAYKPTQLYLPGAVVYYTDTSGHSDTWVCIAPCVGVPPAVGTYWTKLSTLTAAELAATSNLSISTDISLADLSSPTSFSRLAYVAFHCYPSSSNGSADIMGDYESMMCETYDGAGNFQALKFTTNPVWHFLDVLLRRVVRPNYIIGQPLTAQQKACIGWEEFYTAAQYCNQLLAAGQPRFVGNYYFSGNAATTAILERILLSCRGYSRTVGNTVTIYCDQPRATKFYLTQQHIVPNSFKFDKSKIWQSGNRYKATFNDLNIAGIAPISTVQVGTSVTINTVTFTGTTITFENPHPFGPNDVIVIGATDTEAVNGVTGTVIYIADTLHVMIGYDGAAVTANGGTAGLMVSRFGPRISTEVQHASHQRAVAAQAPGVLGARRMLDVPLDFGNSTYEQACRLCKFQRDRDLGPDGTPWIAVGQPSVTANFESVDANGICLKDVCDGDIISIDDTVSYEYPGLYELLEHTVHPPSFQAQGGSFSRSGAVPSLPTADASSGLADLILRPYNPANFTDTADADDADWPPIPGLGLLTGSGNSLAYEVVAVSIALPTLGYSTVATISGLQIQIVGGPLLSYDAADVDVSGAFISAQPAFVFFCVDDPTHAGGSMPIGCTTSRAGAPAGRMWIGTFCTLPQLAALDSSGGGGGGTGDGGGDGSGDSGSGGSCFLNGLVTMADGSKKEIKDVQIGELVDGGFGCINRVTDLYRPQLGNYRSLWTFPAKDLYFTAEHPFWIRQPDGVQNWGVHSFTEYLYEKRYTHVDEQGKYFGPQREPYAICEPVDHAHESGWRRQKALVAREFGDKTELFQLIVDGSHSFVINGYVVSGRTRDDYPYEQVKWTPARHLKKG